MQSVVQFETKVESGVIRIPEQYIKTIPATVKVTFAHVSDNRIKTGVKSKAGALSLGDFSALEINTVGWKFDREESNEKR